MGIEDKAHFIFDDFPDCDRAIQRSVSVSILVLISWKLLSWCAELANNADG
jgi:hypothetical protein